MSAKTLFFAVAIGATGFVMPIENADAAFIDVGTYRLHNHPDGSARPPHYGARLDELYNVTASHDIFTFDFDHATAAMYLEYTGATIHIYGQAYGGRDIGNTYAADSYLGLYIFDFTYNIGVGLEPGDDDVVVTLPAGPNYNYGTVLTPLGHLAGLRDGHYEGEQRDFRFGDTDNDLGHRGFAGLSGWGWLFTALPGEGYYPYTGDSDWLFTAELIPAPGTLITFAGALGLAAGRSRRRVN